MAIEEKGGELKVRWTAGGDSSYNDRNTCWVLLTSVPSIGEVRAVQRVGMGGWGGEEDAATNVLPHPLDTALYRALPAKPGHLRLLDQKIPRDLDSWSLGIFALVIV